MRFYLRTVDPRIYAYLRWDRRWGQWWGSYVYIPHAAYEYSVYL